MDNLRDIIITSLGTILTAGTGVIVTFFKYYSKYMRKKIEKLELDKKNNELQITHLHNGFRDEVKKEILELKQDMKLIKQYLIKGVK